MEFVYVENDISGKRKVDYSLASLRISKRSLISLIHGLKGKNFGFDTAQKIASKIQRYKEKPGYEDVHVYVDSGGYSLIVGDVRFPETAKFIDSYNRYLEFERDTFDSIFSLDIPTWGGEENKKHLTKENLYHFNKKSLEGSLIILKRFHHDDLPSKFHFVWHFKYRTQFETWLKIYDELQLNQHIRCRAIGGLVSLRDFAPNTKFSAFTAMAFKCLVDHLFSPYREDQFKLHVLGIYLQQDRMQLILLEKLFERYLKDQGLPTPLLTHDTINYTLSALYNSRTFEPVHFNGSELIFYKSILDVDDHILKTIYFTQELYDAFCDERERFKANTKYKNSSFIIPLNVYKNIAIDNFLTYVLQKYDIMDIFINSSGENQARKKIRLLINDMKKNLPGHNTENFFSETQNNLDLSYHLWTKLKTKITIGMFDPDIDTAIRQIGLEDPFK